MECASGRRGLFKPDGASVILDDFLYDGESHARPVRLSRADERIKERLADRVGNAASVVDYANVEPFGSRCDINLNFALARRASLASVQQQVEENPFHFLLVEDACHFT